MPSSACDWSSDVCSSDRSEEHTSELQSRSDLVCRLLLEKKKTNMLTPDTIRTRIPTSDRVHNMLGALDNEQLHVMVLKPTQRRNHHITVWSTSTDDSIDR